MGLIMAALQPGTEIGIPCDVKPGPFSGEKLVSFETIDGPVTGFVEEQDLAKQDGHQWYVRAVVLNVGGDVVTVRVEGSFFNTNGLAHIRREMALAA